MIQKGMIIAGRFEILEKIGNGGMSDVYKAKDNKLNRFVAVKILKTEFSEDKVFVNKFRVEAQSAAGLIHANIVNVYDVGDEDGIYYIVMELVEGITLKKYIEKKGALEYKEAVSIAIQMAQGIEAAHKHNIVHRDIKPQNIIISKEGKVKVTDFGIAKATSSNTINSAAMGSVHYISPEQARGGYSDYKSDIYSFGITLYEMITGRVPFDGETNVAVALQHIQEDIVPPSKLVEDVPVSVEKIILKCTQKKTEKRYDSMTEVIADLKRSLVTPNEDFVVPVKSVNNAPTIMLTPEELSTISSKTANKKAAVKYVDEVSLDDDDDDDESYEPVRRPSKARPVVEDDYDDDDDDDDDEDGSTLDKVMMWIGIGVAVVIVCITIFVMIKLVSTINFSGNNNSQNEKTTISDESGYVVMPNLIGKTEEEAKELLNSLGLGYKPEREYNDIFGAGIVLEQSESADEKVPVNTTIIVTISDGSKTFELIDVVGMEESAARALLSEDYNLSVSPEYEFNADVPQGEIIKMVPVAGEEVKSGDVITITVSRGPETTEVVVPNLSNKTESQAREELDLLGLVPVAGTPQYSSTVAEGLVLSQSYSAGKKVTTGTEVEYVLSLGASPTGGSGVYTGSSYIYENYITDKKPETFNDENGTMEVRIVLEQKSGATNLSTEILPYTDTDNMSFPYLTVYQGATGITNGTIQVYVRYTWTETDANNVTSQKQQEINTTTIQVGLSEEE